MALKSWNIADFTGATAEAPVEQVLLEASGVTIMVLSLIVSNYSNLEDANVTVERRGSDNSVKFRWIMELKATDSPLGLDTKMVYTGGDKIVITSDQPDVSAEANGNES